MRKIVAAEYLSLDGVMSGPAWTAPYWSDELGRLQDELLDQTDLFLMGRVTYDGMSKAWPAMAGQPGADVFNSMPKVVPTATLDRLEWNATPVRGDVPAELARLKAEPGGTILIYGSGVLVRSLLREGLIDELRLMVFPVVLGAGGRLFGDDPLDLTLLDSRTTDRGVVVSTYRVGPPRPA